MVQDKPSIELMTSNQHYLPAIQQHHIHHSQHEAGIVSNAKCASIRQDTNIEVKTQDEQEKVDFDHAYSNTCWNLAQLMNVKGDLSN